MNKNSNSKTAGTADERILQGLARAPIFENLSLDDLQTLVAETAIREYEKEARIFSEGDPGDGLYVVLDGEVHISLTDDENKDRHLSKMTGGDFFGEMSLIDETGIRTADASAPNGATCLFLPRENFHQLLSSSTKTSSKILFQLCRVLSGRLAYTSRLAADRKNLAPVESPKTEATFEFKPPPHPTE